jgi:hypothetical protein
MQVLGLEGGGGIIEITDLHFMLEQVEMTGRTFERIETTSDTEQNIKLQIRMSK